jgi:alkylhydroperoxidase family enzyme
MVSMPQEILEALRAQRPLPDQKLDQLREFTLKLMQHRGYVPEAELQRFFSAGYDQRHLLEVLTILAQKTLSNYFNHMAQTPLDEMFMSQQWTPNE